MTATQLLLPIELEELRRILKKYGVQKASIFGSYARGEARSDSDLDILVDYKQGVSLFDHFNLREDLQNRAGRHVDVMSSRSVTRHLEPYINKDKVEIL